MTSVCIYRLTLVLYSILVHCSRSILHFKDYTIEQLFLFENMTDLKMDKTNKYVQNNYFFQNGLENCMA